MDEKRYLDLILLIEQIEMLIKNQVTSSNPLLIEWKNKMQISIGELYGYKSKEYETFCNLRFEPNIVNIQDDYRENMRLFCEKQLLQVKEDWQNKLKISSSTLFF